MHEHSKDLTAEQISEVTAYKVTGLGRLSGAYRGGTECYSTHRLRPPRKRTTAEGQEDAFPRPKAERPLSVQKGDDRRNAPQRARCAESRR